MVLRFNFRALRRTHPAEHLVRFALGGLATVLAGLISKWAGPVVGGLFLALPAIRPASATLMEKHENQKRERAGIPCSTRGRLSAALDARGAVIGSLGLVAFAVIVWLGLPRWGPASTLITAFLVWLGIAISGWWLRRHLQHHGMRGRG